MKIHNISLLFVLLALPFLCSNSNDDESCYHNPVERTSLPDPTIIRASDGIFYLFATEDIRNTPIYCSADLVNWRFLHTAFNDSTRPTFVDKGNVWAPDINYIHGQYVMYYSMSTWGGVWRCGIGIATADKVDGPYHDRGQLFTSAEIEVENSIDPFYIEDDDGQKYLFWGSFHGIYAIPLEDDGLSIRKDATKKLVSVAHTEGTYIYKHDGYYYFIGSDGTCCQGAKSTYHLVVARSTNLLGPYFDKNGESTTTSKLSELLHGGAVAIGPGHCSEIVEDDAGQTWIMYHGYPADDPDVGRCLFLDQVLWDEEGWPYIEGSTPSATWHNPIFNK